MEEVKIACNDFLGSMYKDFEDKMICTICNCEMEFMECSDCGGEGGYDGYDLDPIWYHPGEMAPCHSCNSNGGSWWCNTKDCATSIGCKIIEKPKN